MRILLLTLFTLISGMQIGLAQEGLGIFFPFELEEFPKIIHLGDVIPDNKISFWDETISMIHPRNREIRIIEKRVFWTHWLIDEMGDVESIESIIYWGKISLGIVYGCYQNPSTNSHLLSGFAPDCAVNQFILHIPLAKAH